MEQGCRLLSRAALAERVFVAGELLNELGLLWQCANLHERKRLMAATVDRAYVGENSVTAVMPKAPIYAAMQPACDEVALAGENSCNRRRSQLDAWKIEIFISVQVIMSRGKKTIKSALSAWKENCLAMYR